MKTFKEVFIVMKHLSRVFFPILCGLDILQDLHSSRWTPAVMIID